MEQLETLIPERRGAFSEIATAKAFRFGYVSLPKRQQQAVLPPVYVAEVDTGGEDPMSYLAIVSASEREFLPLRRVGADPAVLERRERQPLPV